MKIGLDDLLKKFDDRIIKIVKEDAEELKARITDIENDYFNIVNKELKLLEAANAVCFTRWPNGSNINTFIDYPDLETLKLFYKHGVYDNPGKDTSVAHELQPGINNQYVSWPSVLGFYAALYTALQHPKKTRHLKNLELGLKIPGVRLDLKNDEFILRLCGYEGVGKEHKDAFTRAMLFSVPGELFQSSIGIAEESELRGAVLALVMADDILKQGGMDNLKNMKLSEFTDRGIGKFGKIGDYLSDDKELLNYFHHFEDEQQKNSSKIILGLLELYVRGAKQLPVMRNMPILNYFYNNARSSIEDDGYLNLKFGEFPKKDPYNYPRKMMKIFPELGK